MAIIELLIAVVGALNHQTDSGLKAGGLIVVDDRPRYTVAIAQQVLKPSPTSVVVFEFIHYKQVTTDSPLVWLVTKEEISCTDSKIRASTVKGYNGAGHRVIEAQEPASWQNIVPGQGSVSNLIFKYGCLGAMPPNARFLSSLNDLAEIH